MRELSCGVKRHALVHKTPVIVLDELTAGVDVELRHTLWTFIVRLNREGQTVVLTTHYLEETQEQYNRIAMLNLGQVMALDSTSVLIKHIAGSQLLLQLSGGGLRHAGVVIEEIQLQQANLKDVFLQIMDSKISYGDLNVFADKYNAGGVK